MLPFKNFSDLRKHFETDISCALFLENQRWNGTPLCPHCGSEHHARTKTRLKNLAGTDYKDFRCKACDKKYSVLTGTIYQSSPISLTTWFQAVYLISAHKKGISSLQLASDLGVTQKTAWFMLHRIRSCYQPKTQSSLGSNGEIVEVDETIVGGKTHNKTKSHRTKVREGKIHPMANKSIVMGMVERQGEMHMKVINSRADILPSVIEKVSTEASLITDSSGVYLGAYKTHAKHQIIDHSNDEFVKGNVHTNSVEGVFSLFDRMVIGIYHYISPKHTQRYCDEFSFRFNNRRIKDVEKFAEAIKRCEGRLDYKTLVFKPSF